MIPRARNPEVTNLALFDADESQNNQLERNKGSHDQSFLSVSSFEQMFKLGADKDSFKTRSKQRPQSSMDAPDFPQSSLRVKGPMLALNPASATGNVQDMPPRPFSTAPKSKSSFTGFGSIKGPIKAGPFTLSFLGKSSKEKKVNQKDSEHFSSRSQYGRNMEMASSDQFEPLSKNMRKKKTLTQQENWKSNSLPRNVAFPESQSVQISGREPHRLRRASFNGGGLNTVSNSLNSNSNAFTPPSSSKQTRSTTHKRQGSYSGSSGGDSGCRLSSSGGPDSRMGSSDGIQRSAAATGAGAMFKYTNSYNNSSRDNQVLPLNYNEQSKPGSITSSPLSNISGPDPGVGGSNISFLVEHLTSFTMSREDTLWTVDDAIRKLKLQDVKGKIWSQEMQLDITASALNLVDVESGEQIDSFPYNGITHVEAVLLADYHLNSILAFIYRDNTGRKPEIFLFQCDQTPADEVVAEIQSAMLAFKKNKSSKYAKAASKSKKKAAGGRLGVSSYMSASASDINMQGQFYQQNGGLSPRMRSESPGSTISSASTVQARNSKLFGEPQHLGVYSGRSSDSGARPGMSNTAQRRKHSVRATAQETAAQPGEYRQRSSYFENNSVTYYKDNGCMDDLVDNLQVDMGSLHSVGVTGGSLNGRGGSDLYSQNELSVLQQLALRVERQVAILNHCFDDIELFAKQLKMVHDAQQELVKRKKNGEKKKRPNAGDNMLEYRARMPSETSYIDTFQKFKLSFNLLAPLKKHIQQPNAPELVHSLFSPLAKICESEQGMELARGVLSPLLSEDAVQLLENCLNSEERAFWNRLGNAWTVSKDKWPREHYEPPYKPVFRDGWEPPLLERHNGTNSQERVSGGAVETSSRSSNARSSAVSNISNFDYDQELEQRPLNDAPRSFAPTPHILASNTRAANVIGESNNASFSMQGSPPVVVGKPPTSVVATNDFVARNHKELSVLQDEVLEVIDCTRKWWAVRNSSGQMGYVPSTILTPMTSSVHHGDATGSGRGPGEMPHTSTFHHQMQNVVNLSNQMMENKILHQPQSGLPIPSMQQQSYMSIPAPPPPGIVQNATHRGLQQQNGGPDGGAPPPPPPPPPVVEQTQPKKLVIPAKKSTPKPKPDQKRNTEVISELNGGEFNGSSGPATEEVPPHAAAAGALSSPKRVASAGAASVITHSSTPAQVRDWLSSKGFSKLTVDSLGILNGAQLFSLSRQELTDVCFQEGAKVFSFVTVQKSLASNNNQQADSNGTAGSDPVTHF